MGAEWRASTVGAEAEILLGFAFKSAEFATEPPGHRLVRGDNVKRGVIEWGDKARYWRDPTPDLEKYLLHSGDVVVGMDGSRVGENFARISSDDLPAFLVQRVACLRAGRHLDQVFLRYLICNPAFTGYIKAVQTGTSIPHISGGQIGAYPISVPPRDEQRAIAHILSSLDDKIELNHRMSETLVSMVSTLFRSWFIDFDPVKAKREGRDPHLPKNIIDLFPDSFQDSLLGKVPNGFRVLAIRDLTRTIQYGLTQSSSAKQVGPRFLRITDIQGGRVEWATVPFCKVTAEEHEKYRLHPGDVLVARTGASTGENLFLQAAPDAVFASYLVRFQFADIATARFVGAFMRTQTYFDFVAAAIGGSAQPNASAQVLANAPLLVPPPQLAQAFADLVLPLDARIRVNSEESRSLADLRDTLLPRLTSGELRPPGRG